MPAASSSGGAPLTTSPLTVVIVFLGYGHEEKFLECQLRLGYQNGQLHVRLVGLEVRATLPASVFVLHHLVNGAVAVGRENTLAELHRQLVDGVAFPVK